MSKFERRSFIDQDIDECRKLAEVFFEDEQVGIYRREAYAPLDFPLRNDENPTLPIPCFLRMTTSIEDNIQVGSVEMVECFSNGDMDVRSAYLTTGDGEVHSKSSQYALPVSPQLSWPKVFFAPQINSCLDGLRNPRYDPEIESDELLEELIQIPDSENHIVQKNISDIEVDGFSISIDYKKHAMPYELAATIRQQTSFAEQYRFSVKRNGTLNNDIYLCFGRGGKLEYYKDAKNRNPNTTIARLAAFSRMVLN